jgi:hypothetical protein
MPIRLTLKSPPVRVDGAPPPGCSHSPPFRWALNPTAPCAPRVRKYRDAGIRGQPDRHGYNDSTSTARLPWEPPRAVRPGLRTQDVALACRTCQEKITRASLVSHRLQNVAPSANRHILWTKHSEEETERCARDRFGLSGAETGATADRHILHQPLGGFPARPRAGFSFQISAYPWSCPLE